MPKLCSGDQGVRGLVHLNKWLSARRPMVVASSETAGVDVGDKTMTAAFTARVGIDVAAMFVEREIAGRTLWRGAKITLPLSCSMVVCGHDGERHHGGRNTAVRELAIPWVNQKRGRWGRSTSSPGRHTLAQRRLRSSRGGVFAGDSCRSRGRRRRRCRRHNSSWFDSPLVVTRTSTAVPTDTVSSSEGGSGHGGAQDHDDDGVGQKS